MPPDHVAAHEATAADEQISQTSPDDAKAGESTPADALRLGWRVAQINAATFHIAKLTRPKELLPADDALAPEDQMELQIRSAASLARRLGVYPPGTLLEEFLVAGREASGSPQNAGLFRAQLLACHVDLLKALWARSEAAGNAYELGIAVSEIYGRISRSYTHPDSFEAWESADMVSTWLEVFGAENTERLERLLTDLQKAIDPRAVAIVRSHLHTYRDVIPERLRDAGGPPPSEFALWGLHRQTLIWRQLLVGDVDPERYLDSRARLELMPEFRRDLRQHQRRFYGPALLAVLLGAWLVTLVGAWYQDNIFSTGIGALIVGVIGIAAARRSLTADIQARYHDLV